MNIVSMIMQYFGPVILGKFASSLGVNNTIAQKAISVLAPTILAALIGKASQPGGGQILADVLGKQDPGLLGKLGDMLGGPQQKAVVDQGTNVLGSLLGNSAMGSIAGAIGKYAGLGDGPSKSLIGMLAPVLLGTLGAQQKSQGLDAGGLVKMLMGQKDNIAAAIPGDFSKLLGGTGLLDSLQGAPAMKPVTAAPATAPMAAKPAMASTPAAPRSVVHEKARDGSHFTWWPWLVAIAAAGLLWWNLFGGKVLQPALAPVPTQKILAGNIDVGQEMTGVFETLRASAGSVRDAASAQQSLVGMQDTSKKLDRLGELAGSLPPEAKRALADYVAKNIGVIEPLLSKLLAIPGVGPILKPVVEQLLARMTQISKI